MLNAKGTALCDGCDPGATLVCIQRQAAYPLSYRHLQEVMQKRDVLVEHASISRWAMGGLTLLQKGSRKNSAVLGCADQWTKPVSKSQVTGQ